jgi:hypothetical protein
MNIESPKWMDDLKLCLSVTINGTHMAVPADEANMHYAAILAWVAFADENVIEDADPE